MLSDTTTRVLLAVLDGARTTRAVQHATGISSTSVVHRHLLTLKAHQLVDWQAKEHGTLHATCRPVTTKARPQPGCTPVADGPSGT